MACEWRTATLGESVEFTSGGTPNKSEPRYWEGDIPWISASSMKDIRVADSELKITEAGLKNGSRLTDSRSILLLVRGSELHKRIPVCMAMRPMAFNQDVKSLRPREGILPEYLLYWLLAMRKELLNKVEDTGIGAGKLDSAVLKALRVGIPCADEQRAIAQILGTLDDKIELNRRMNETLEAMARTLFKSWFVDFDPVRAKLDGRWRKGQSLPGLPAHLYDLFPDRLVPSELGEIPEGWEVANIGQVTTCVGGSTPSTKEPSYWNGEIAFATPKDLAALSSPALLRTERRITEKGASQISSRILPVGTVLLASRAPIGYLAISEIPVSVNQGFIAIICDKELPNQYVLNWARVNMDIIVSQANGTTFLEVSKSAFRPIPVIVPPKALLDGFVGRVEPLYRRIVSNLRGSESLAAIRDVLLPKLISGEIRVKDAERFVESVGV